MTYKARDIGGNWTCLWVFYVAAFADGLSTASHLLEGPFIYIDTISFPVPCIYTLYQLINGRDSHLPTP